MTIIDEIREYFATGFLGARPLKTAEMPYRAWTLRFPEEYGVAFSFDSETVISEKFASVKIQSRYIEINGITENRLFLSCDADDLQYEFAYLCAEFADPGEHGKNRISIMRDPAEWWKKWRRLLGNAVSRQRPYAVIGEMLVYEKLLKERKAVIWQGPNANTHDLESRDEAFEVKSTLKKTGTDITISSEFQLQSEKPLQLYFCRFEQSPQGSSINDLVKRLSAYLKDISDVENNLRSLGYEQGRSSREEKYRLLEGLIYDVDQSFPKIVEESFAGGKKPTGITHIEYTVDLAGIKSRKWF